MKKHFLISIFEININTKSHLFISLFNALSCDRFVSIYSADFCLHCHYYHQDLFNSVIGPWLLFVVSIISCGSENEIDAPLKARIKSYYYVSHCADSKNTSAPPTILRACKRCILAARGRWHALLQCIGPHSICSFTKI